MRTTYEVATLDRRHRARVSLREGCYVFVVAEGDKIVEAGGADRELPTVEDLVEASKQWCDWRYSSDVLRELRAARLLGYSREAQELLASIM